MKRNAILMFLVFVMVAGLSGCILSTQPSTGSPITLKVGVSQTFTVSGFLNGPYEWYKNGSLIGGAAGATYTYYAEAGDKGTNTFKVQTKDMLNGKTLVKEWTVNVYYNLPPIANAGPDQNVYFGNDVSLDGSASSDPESQSLIYLWSMVQRPAGSNAALDDPYRVNPSFTPDVQGAYTVRLIVNDGESNSASDAVVINVYSDFLPPTADAGADQSVVFGNAVHLDGNGSSDPEHHSLTYTWGIDTAPAGSAAVLDNIHSMTPSFMPDKKGLYVLRLVVNDGTFDSGVDWVNITIYNTAPNANAGDDITVADFGGTAHLDGSLSIDPDGTTLTYSWSITSRPGGSSAILSSNSIVNPTFTPDKKGAYIMTLTVSDGDLTAEDTVQVTYSNHVPVAEAGAPISIPYTQTAQLGGSGTDPDNDPLTYAWTIDSAPVGSTAALSDANIANPYFTPDKKGVYTFSLIVKDNENLSSAPDTVTISTTNNAPVANAGSDINILSHHSAQLNGSGSDIDGDPLTYVWTVVSAPSGSIAALSNRFISNPTFIPDKKGDYTLSLVVNDGTVNSNADTLQISSNNNAPVAEAGANQTVHYASRMAQVNGNGSSDIDGDPLTYAWTVTSKPSGSTAALSSTTVMNPTITLDKPGAYVINLVVNDGTENSGIDTVTLTTSQATIIQDWENGMGTWSVTTAIGNVDRRISSTRSNSPSNSYDIHSNLSSGTTNTTIVTTPVNAYMISVGLWLNWFPNFLGGSSINTKLLLDGAIFKEIGPDDPPTFAKNTWAYRGDTSTTPYAIDRYVSTLAFAGYDYIYSGADEMFFDDITYVIWD